MTRSSSGDKEATAAAGKPAPAPAAKLTHPDRDKDGRWKKGRSGNPVPKTAWKPGQSGNPLGAIGGVKEIRELALQHAPKAVEKLCELLELKDRPDLVLAAACALLDRAGAKPRAEEPNRLEVTHDIGGDSRAVLAALLSRRAMAVTVLAGAGSVAGQPEPAPSRDDCPRLAEPVGPT